MTNRGSRHRRESKPNRSDPQNGQLMLNLFRWFRKNKGLVRYYVVGSIHTAQ